MGLAQISHTTDSTGAPVTSVRGVGPALLRGLTVVGLRTGIAKGQVLVRVSLQRGGVRTAEAGVTFIHDYVYDNFFPSWDGEIELDPGDEILMETTSVIAVAVRCNVLTFGRSKT